MPNSVARSLGLTLLLLISGSNVGFIGRVMEHGPKFDTMGRRQMAMMDEGICWKGFCGCYRQRKKSKILDTGQKYQGRRVLLLIVSTQTVVIYICDDTTEREKSHHVHIV